MSEAFGQAEVRPARRHGVCGGGHSPSTGASSSLCSLVPGRGERERGRGGRDGGERQAANFFLKKEI